MGNQTAHVEPAGEDEPGDLGLQREIGRVAADQVFFVQTDGGQIKGKSGNRQGEIFRFPISDSQFVSFGVGEQQDLAAAAHELERLKHRIVGGNGDDGGVKTCRM